MDRGKALKTTGPFSSKQGQDAKKVTGKRISKAKKVQLMLALMTISKEEKVDYLEKLEDTVGKMRKLQYKAIQGMAGGPCQGLMEKTAEKDIDGTTDKIASDDEDDEIIVVD